MNREQFVNTVFEIRLDLGLTQEKFCKLAGIDVCTLSKIINNRMKPSRLAIAKLVKAQKEHCPWQL